MSSCSISYLKGWTGNNSTWNSPSSATSPYMLGYGNNSYLYGTLHKVTVNVTAGYSVTRLTLNLPSLKGDRSAGTCVVWALFYTSDPSNSMGQGEPPATYSFRASSSSISAGTAGVSNIQMTASNLDIRSTTTYYVFITTTCNASSWMAYAPSVGNTTCSLSEYELPVPATSVSISTSPFYMNANTTISWSPYRSDYTYKISYKFTSSGTKTVLVPSTPYSSYTWNPSASTFGPSIPNSVSGTMTIYVESYKSNGDPAGSECSGSFTLNLPSTGRNPTCPIGWASATYSTNVSDHCIASYSGITVTIDTSIITYNYGATAASTDPIVAVCSNGQSRTNTGSLGIATEGNNVVTVTAKDSRGLTTQYSATIVGEAYTSPSFTSLTVERCDSSGTSSNLGEYYKVTPVIAYTSFNGDNTLTIQTAYKALSSSSYGTYTDINNNEPSQELGDGLLDTGSSYMIQVVVYDSVITSSNSISQTRILENTTTSATLNLRNSGLGAAFFGLATDDELQVYRNVHIVTPGKLVLNDSMYGSGDPPTTGAVVGQIYLKLID